MEKEIVEKGIIKIGEQLISLTREQAEELRRYIIEEHGLVLGVIESLVGEKSLEDPDDRIWMFRSNEFSYWFMGPQG